jgi:hypothetical protein
MTPRIFFTPSVYGAAIQYTVNGNTYPYLHEQDGVTRSDDGRYAAFKTPLNTLITFTATYDDNHVTDGVEYKWDFGDGGIGYGKVITHVYKIVQSEAVLKLSVMNTRGRRISRNFILNPRQAVYFISGSETVYLSDIASNTTDNVQPTV